MDGIFGSLFFFYNRVFMDYMFVIGLLLCFCSSIFELIWDKLPVDIYLGFDISYLVLATSLILFGLFVWVIIILLSYNLYNIQMMSVINFFLLKIRKQKINIKQKTNPWINQEQKIRKNIKISNLIVAAATVIVKKAEKEAPWYITYWPVILTVTVVSIIICIYYFYPEGHGLRSNLRPRYTTWNTKIVYLQNCQECQILEKSLNGI